MSVSSENSFDIGCAAPTPRLPPPPDSESACDGGRDDQPQPHRKRRRRRQIALQSTHLLIVFILIDSEVRMPQEFMARLARSVDSYPRYQGRIFRSIIGVACLEYSLSCKDDDPGDKDFLYLRRHADTGRRVKKALGYIEYKSDNMYFLDTPYDIADANELTEMHMSSLQWRSDLAQSSFGGETLLQLQAAYDCDPPTFAIRVSPAHGELLHKDLVSVLSVVSISARPSYKCVVPEFPKKTVLLKWLRTLQPTDPHAEDATMIDYLIELPPSAPSNPQSYRQFNSTTIAQHDAIHLLKCMRFSRHLHSQEVMGEAIDGAIEAMVDDNSLFDEIYKNKGANPGKSVLRAGRLQLDATAMLLDRRYFRDLININSETVQSAHIYTDGSPVTGTELQALLLELFFHDGTMVTKILPGVGMKGGYSLGHKAFSLLWSLYLVIGAWPKGLRDVLSWVKSVTTDMGTELGFVDVPDFVDAFLLWLGGKPFATLQVNPATRLLPNALRLAGWSHMFGNLMKHAAQSLEEWKVILKHLRALCRFFRVRAWRSTIIRKGAPSLNA
jgi:hypothetical protein